MSAWQQIRENQTAIPKEELSLIVTLSFLQAQRIKQGISQTEFAKRINMTQPQLAKIENLDCTPTLAMLNKYAKGLGLDIKEGSVQIKKRKDNLATTGKIPLEFSLTSEQMADLQLRNAVKKLPVKKLRTKKEIEDFFNDED